MLAHDRLDLALLLHDQILINLSRLLSDVGINDLHLSFVEKTLRVHLSVLLRKRVIEVPLIVGEGRLIGISTNISNPELVVPLLCVWLICCQVLLETARQNIPPASLLDMSRRHSPRDLILCIMN